MFVLSSARFVEKSFEVHPLWRHGRSNKLEIFSENQKSLVNFEFNLIAISPRGYNYFVMDIGKK